MGKPWGRRGRATVLKAPSWGSAGHAEELGSGDWCLLFYPALYRAQACHSSLRTCEVLRLAVVPVGVPSVSQNLFYQSTCPSEVRKQEQGNKHGSKGQLGGHCVTHTVSPSGTSVSTWSPPSSDHLLQQRMLALDVILFRCHRHLWCPLPILLWDKVSSFPILSLPNC